VRRTTRPAAAARADNAEDEDAVAAADDGTVDND